MSDFNENKVVSIEFDNQQFEKDVSKTIDTIDRLDEATSSKNLNGEGIASLSKAFSNLNQNATQDIDQINSKLSDTSSYSKLSDSVGEVNNQFSTLQMIGIGALLAIGETAVSVGSQIARTLTAGIRDGWSEYNLIMDSTQTILANTQRYGTDLDDVTGALDVLNEYADKTIYNFSQMTRNIGLFTTAGMNLEDSVTAIKGMANLGAVFGADNAAMARATYQISQAMSSGYVRLRDWMSMENAGMGGKLLQEELIKTAAIMSGQSVDAFKEYIGYSKGFRNTLETNWLTADIYLETMRKFAGESREYWESLKAADGSRLYTDEEIDELMKTAAAAEEAATKVRTFKMMIEALMESIGSGWSTTFRLLIGDLEQAKEFWTPINDLLSGLVNRVSDYRNNIIKSWADVYRNIAVEDMMTALKAIGGIFEAIGRGISRAFGSTHSIAGSIGRVTEAIGDLATTLTLTDEELEMLSDFVEGLLSPLTLFGDLIYDLTRTFFNASDAMNEFDTRGESLVDKMQGIRRMFFGVLQIIGNFGKRITELIRNSGVISSAVNIFAKAVKGLYDITYSFLTWVTPILRDIFNNYILPFIGLFVELASVSWQWLKNLGSELSALDINLLEDFKNIFNGLRDIFIALTDPTIDVADAIQHFKEILSNTSIASIIDTIKNSLNGLWDSLKNTHLFQFFIEQFNRFKQSDVGVWLFDMVERLKNVVSTIFGSFRNLGDGGGFLGVIQSIIDHIIPLKNQIADLGLVDSAIVILKSVFATIGELISSVVHGLGSSIGAIDFESNVETIANRIIKTVEILMILGSILAVANLPRFFGKTAHNIIFQIFDPISDMFLVVKERFKRDTWKVLGDFFKSLAIFVGVMTASILVLASLKDPYIALPLLVTMFGGIALIVGLIISGMTNMFSAIKNAGLSGIGQGFAMVSSLRQIGVILTEIIVLIGVISAVAYLFSRADSETRSAMMAAFGALVATFALISSFMIILLDKMTANFPMLAALGGNLTIAQKAYTKILDSLLKIMLVMGLMMALIIKVSNGNTNVILASALSIIASLAVVTLLASHLINVAKTLVLVDPKQITMVANLIKSMGFAFLLISAALAILSKTGGDAATIVASAISLTLTMTAVSVLAFEMLKFSNTIATVKSGTVAKLGGFILLLSAVGVILAYTLKMMLTESPEKIMEATLALVLVVGAFSLLGYKFTELSNNLGAVKFTNILKIASSMLVMIGTLLLVLSAMKQLNDIIKTSGLDTVKTSLLILAGIFAAMLVVMAVMSDMQKSGLTNTSSMLGAAASMLILSAALIPIAASIAIISAISVDDGSAAIRAAGSIILVLMSMGIILAGMSVLWDTLKTNALMIAAAVVSIMLISQSLITIATALMMVGSIPDITSSVNALSRIIWSIAGILGIFGILSALSEGIGAAVLLAVAGAFVVMAAGIYAIGKGILFMGMAADMAGTGVKKFAEAMAIMEAINPERLLRSFYAIANFFPIMAEAINANREIIKQAIITFFRSIGTGIAESIRIIFITIGQIITQGFVEHFRIIMGILVELFDILLVTIHGLLSSLNEFLKKEIGPGGVLRELAITLSDFILWLAQFLGTFMLTAVTTVIESLADALENDGIITRLFNAVKHLILSVKLALYNWLGVASLGEWISQTVIALVGMVVDGVFAGAQTIVDAFNTFIEGLTGSRSDTLDNLYSRLGSSRENALVSFGETFSNFQENSINEVQSQIDELDAETDALNARLEEEQARQRAIEAEGDTSVYNPSRYYAAAAGVENWNNQMSQTPGIIGSISDALSGTDGLGGIIGSIFGSGGSGALSNLFGGEMFSSGGEQAGSDWSSGFASGLGDSSSGLSTISNMDFSNLDSINNVDFSNFNTGLENASFNMDELSSPVITPVIDDTEYNMGLNRMEDTWNGHHFDEFAIDAGNSMLLREQAEGNASTDGETSVAFYQYNYSPEARSPIQTYRDTRNLIRGSGSFTSLQRAVTGGIPN